MNNRMSMNQSSLIVAVVAFIVGALLGWLLLGAVILTPLVKVVDTDPWDLNPAAKQQWVTMVADSFSLGQDLNLARERLRGYSNDQVTQFLRQSFTERNQRGDATGAARLQAFSRVYGVNLGGGGAPPSQPTSGQANDGGGLIDRLGTLLLLLAALILVIALGLFLYMRFRTATPVRQVATQPIAPQQPYTGPATVAYQQPVPAVSPSPIREQPVMAPPIAPTQPAARTPAAMARSLGTFAATYKFGEDNYDTSFTLETARGEFLGECGMGSSETIGEGKPDKVTAFDAWLFDKTDVRTVTQILMSEWAYNDQTTRARLATKGELAQAEKGKIVRLETATLSVEAEVKELIYASTPGLPPNSHFQKLIVEMVPTQKS